MEMKDKCAIEINAQTRCSNEQIVEAPLIPYFERHLNINAFIDVNHLIAECFVCSLSKLSIKQNTIYDGYDEDYDVSGELLLFF